ncbi:MAG: divalent-cation tolerance protein CutA [Chromatiales bacterium 21-64-14]|nr:MAG: divalent-cation tolerance protein CutA [Chromatiales bacterium 21-64-14]HQU15302.1 divalent-cation tolerance protein CutA [Gammaproteobacteria bacterium]
MSDGYLVVLCTCPDRDTAVRIAQRLVDERQAACVNVVPGLLSIYAWEGTRHQDEEVLLVIKTREEVFQAVQDTVRTLHPYELPEIIAVEIKDGLRPYLDWIAGAVTRP